MRNGEKKRGGDVLNAVNLKEHLWATLKDVKRGKMKPGSGDAIASQAREILRTVKAQLAIIAASGKSVSNELVEFARPSK